MAIRRTEKMKKLEEERLRLEREIEGLNRELSAIKRAIAMVSGEPLPAAIQKPDRKPRVAVKEVILGLLEEFREEGLTAVETVEMAAARGTALDRGSTSSYLSRLKREGLVDFRNSKYRLHPAGAGEAGPADADVRPKLAIAGGRGL